MKIKNIIENIGKIRERNLEAKRNYMKVQEAIRDKELEEEAKPIAEKYGVDIEAAKIYVAKNKKVEQRKAGFKRLIENMGKLNLPAAKVSDEITLKPKPLKPMKLYPKSSLMENTSFMNIRPLKPPEVKLPKLDFKLRK